LLIQYNIISGLFPNPNYALSVPTQNIILFAAGFMMGMYFPYYFYKAFNLLKLKFYAYWGSVFFIFIPFIVLFLIPYYITKDLESSKKLLLIVAFVYASSFLFALSRAIKVQTREQKVLKFKKEIISVYIGAIFWISLPIISFFEVMTNSFFAPIFHFNDTSQVIEMVVTNAGLVMMTVVYIRQSIRQSRDENEKLEESEAKLKEMNSRLQRLNEDLLAKVQERTKELELANEQRTNTFINLAHDIKTPLTLINNYLDECISEYPDIDSLKIVQHNIDKLNRNVINFFDTERIRKGVIIYDNNHIEDLSKILNDHVFLFQKLGKKKNIIVTAEINNSLYVKADPDSLSRIINNVIENALKYTDDNGKVHVSLSSDDKKIHFSIKDNGVGISPEFHEKIFDSTSQIKSKKVNSQGMGLGLPIAKKIVDELNGKIRIISNPEIQKGTEFIIEFERYFPEQHEIIANYKSPKIYAEIDQLLAKDDLHDDHLPTLLIVEDNISLLNLMYNRLKIHYNLYISLSGNEAIEKLKSIKKLDLIISDVMMDYGDGFELYTNVYKQKRFKHIPFIFITAKTEDKIKGLELGAVDYILKPFSMEELHFKVEAILKSISENINVFSSLLHRSAVNIAEIENTATEPIKDNFEENCIKYKLTGQERRIIPLIGKGHTNREIAAALNISDKTVKTHLQNLFEKVGVSGKVELLIKLEFSEQSTKNIS
jgi:signal transduction histidine kinase/DNA-binding NarL/FixJ family response regulator